MIEDINSLSRREQNEIKSKIKTYHGINAKINKLLHRTFKVEGEIYDKKELTKSVVKLITDDQDLSSKFKSSKKIQKEIESLIEAYAGNDLAIGDLLSSAIQHRIEMEKLGHKPSSKVEILRILDDINPDKIPAIKWPADNDLTEIEKKLKPGDMIFMQNRGDLEGLLDKTIVKSQKISKRWLKGDLEPAVETYTHVAIYLGNGMIAEATPGTGGHDVRILPLAHQKIRLERGEAYEYRICRAKDENIAKEAARLAGNYAEEKIKGLEDQVGGPTQLKYTHKAAISSLVGTPKFDKKAKRKALAEGYLSSELPLPKNAKGKQRQFFCSHFVAYCLQVGNAGIVIHDLIEKHHLQPPLEELKGKNEKEKIKIINKWAKKVMKENPKILDDIQMDFDPKNLSPQKFRSVIGNNPGKFEDVFRLIPL